MAKEKIPKPKKFQQNHDVAVHFHPRRLARQICHARAEQGASEHDTECVRTELEKRRGKLRHMKRPAGVSGGSSVR